MGPIRHDHDNASQELPSSRRSSSNSSNSSASHRSSGASSTPQEVIWILDLDDEDFSCVFKHFPGDISPRVAMNHLHKARDELAKARKELADSQKASGDMRNVSIVPLFPRVVNVLNEVYRQMTSPVSLQCGHDFCGQCVFIWFKTKLTAHVGVHPGYNPRSIVPEQMLTALRKKDLSRLIRTTILATLDEMILKSPHPRYTCPTCRSHIRSPPTANLALKQAIQALSQASGSRTRIDHIPNWDHLFPVNVRDFVMQWYQNAKTHGEVRAETVRLGTSVALRKPPKSRFGDVSGTPGPGPPFRAGSQTCHAGSAFVNLLYKPPPYKACSAARERHGPIPYMGSRFIERGQQSATILEEMGDKNPLPTVLTVSGIPPPPSLLLLPTSNGPALLTFPTLPDLVGSVTGHSMGTHHPISFPARSSLMLSDRSPLHANGRKYSAGFGASLFKTSYSPWWASSGPAVAMALPVSLLRLMTAGPWHSHGLPSSNLLKLSSVRRSSSSIPALFSDVIASDASASERSSSLFPSQLVPNPRRNVTLAAASSSAFVALSIPLDVLASSLHGEVFALVTAALLHLYYSVTPPPSRPTLYTDHLNSFTSSPPSSSPALPLYLWLFGILFRSPNPAAHPVRPGPYVCVLDSSTRQRLVDTIASSPSRPLPPFTVSLPTFPILIFSRDRLHRRRIPTYISVLWTAVTKNTCVLLDVGSTAAGSGKGGHRMTCREVGETWEQAESTRRASASNAGKHIGLSTSSQSALSSKRMSRGQWGSSGVAPCSVTIRFTVALQMPKKLKSYVPISAAQRCSFMASCSTRMASDIDFFDVIELAGIGSARMGITVTYVEDTGVGGGKAPAGGRDGAGVTGISPDEHGFTFHRVHVVRSLRNRDTRRIAPSSSSGQASGLKASSPASARA
ncbi:hypothetical protein LXA43DRAFT_1068644 [Ganoderma leucocontextum]|nr:hypothetical protein LXA43DRAFT_1068644 [Ganoderma leucocontextum]